ncbi:hypothetical protein [Salisediminibacterium beveridgei]|uniref:hypothetical protein n=1 Tax=Salisediminibacterium beveridgei TaxID=632773 RepID=UPI0012EE919C|nr:hypothetical protein [Salisediminibacterium beveridgei]
MVYRILLIITILIVIVNFLITPLFFDNRPDDTGTFIALILICIILSKLLEDQKVKK